MSEREKRPYMHDSYLEELHRTYPTAAALIQWQADEIERLHLELQRLRETAFSHYGSSDETTV